MARKDFEGTSAKECRPLGRRLRELSKHAERIQWPVEVVDDLKTAGLILEILAEDAERDDG